ncbi:MAG: hypothetical protein N3A01_00105 [Bacteroidales bacterium]|nr:hypothetical protein [Bacteroidales bacterium]
MRVVIITIISLFITGSCLFSQKKEYFILRVTYLIKPARIECKLEVDLGTKAHTLKNIIENTSDGALKIKNDDGTIFIIKNEVDFINFIQKYNYKLINSYTFTQLDKSYVNFLFEKDL